ncbi:MAG: DNA primase [Desulfurococcus sp.]|nr:DNA primase [Desulfurococcus sp.]
MSLHAKNRVVFLRSIIRSYYRLKPLEEPLYLHMREIALESLEDGKYIRHLSFPYMERLYEFLESGKTPLHLYYSSALYSDPSASSMDSKGWQGSELVFDIDADKYPGCSTRLTICLGAGAAGGGGECPPGVESVEYKPVKWECIVRAWRDVTELYSILRGELGFKSIEVYFSGNRGFHIRVLDEEILQLTRDQRRLIADYVACSNLDTRRVLPSFRGRVLFREREREHGLRRRVLEAALARGLARKGTVAGLKGLVVEEEVVSKLIGEQCINIDKAVTVDTSRLSRFINSLNMKSGLRVARLKPDSSIEDLNFTFFSPFRGVVKVKPVVSIQGLQVLDESISLKAGETISLKAPLAVYLAIHGLVFPVEWSGIEVKL